MDAEAAGADGRRRRSRWRRRWRRPASCACSASPSSAARARRRRRAAQEVDRFSLTAMAGACAALPARRHASRPDDRRAEAGGADWPSARRCRCNRRSPGSRSRRSRRAAAPTTACWCSCSSSSRAAWRRPRSTASPPTALRRAPAWDCGFPEPSPATQYTARELRQPIRRVFGGFAFGARESVDMPPPGDLRPARYDAADARPDLALGLCADRARRRRAPRRGSMRCSS